MSTILIVILVVFLLGVASNRQVTTSKVQISRLYPAYTQFFRVNLVAPWKLAHGSANGCEPSCVRRTEHRESRW
jgi:hypothetical protein